MIDKRDIIISFPIIISTIKLNFYACQEEYTCHYASLYAKQMRTSMHMPIRITNTHVYTYVGHKSSVFIVLQRDAESFTIFNG